MFPSRPVGRLPVRVQMTGPGAQARSRCGRGLGSVSTPRVGLCPTPRVGLCHQFFPTITAAMSARSLGSTQTSVKFVFASRRGIAPQTMATLERFVVSSSSELIISGRNPGRGPEGNARAWGIAESVKQNTCLLTVRFLCDFCISSSILAWP